MKGRVDTEIIERKWLINLRMSENSCLIKRHNNFLLNLWSGPQGRKKYECGDERRDAYVYTKVDASNESKEIHGIQLNLKNMKEDLHNKFNIGEEFLMACMHEELVIF